LVLKNTWLVDEGRITFNQDKVMIDVNASNLGQKDHTLKGTNAEDILRDLNGGNDTLIGGGW